MIICNVHNTNTALLRNKNLNRGATQDEQSFIPTDNLEKQVSMTLGVVDCGRNPEHPQNRLVENMQAHKDRLIIAPACL